MKKRIYKKFSEASKMMGKRLSGRYAQTIARRIDTYGEYDCLYFCEGGVKTNKSRRYVIHPCIDLGVDCSGVEYEKENGFFALEKIGGNA